MAMDGEVAVAASLFLGAVAVAMDGEGGGWRIWKIRTEIHFLPGGREVGVSWVDGRKHKKEGQVSLPLDSGGSDGGCQRSVGGLEQPIRMQELPHARYAL